jgi:signal transduction histidine kinase
VLANQAMLAIQLTRLSEQSRRAAVTAERHRLMHDVHDTLAQAFTGVIVQLQAADDATARGLVAEAGAHVARAEEMARSGLKEARRSVMALRPEALESGDVPTALKELLSRMTTGTSITTEFSQRGATRSLSESRDEHLLRIGQEALTNALRHSAGRHIVVRFTFDSEQVQLEVSDDGRGFDDSANHAGLGLVGMKSRATSMGGQLVVRSRNGLGTTILVTVPQRQAPT